LCCVVVVDVESDDFTAVKKREKKEGEKTAKMAGFIQKLEEKNGGGRNSYDTNSGSSLKHLTLSRHNSLRKTPICL
jgi:hypothetical protein